MGWFRTFTIVLIVMLAGCSKSVDYYVENEDEAVAKVYACEYPLDGWDSSECCNANLAIDRKVESVRQNVGDKNIAEYKKKVCSGLEMDKRLCYISEKVEEKIAKEYSKKLDDRVKFYFNNRDELRKMFNNCGDELYKIAGLPLPRDGEYLGASGYSKIFKA